MRNPNYNYTPTLDPDGWTIHHPQDGTIAWGKTKAAARSRLLRMLRHNAKVAATQANQEEVNDQS